MNVLIQFDVTGEYKDGAWGRPVSFRKGEIHSVSPISAIVLIEEHKAHIYHKATNESLEDLDEG